MFEAANPSINALAALEQLKFDEQDEAAFNEGLTLGKIAFALPVIEHVLRDKKIDSQLCREAITFLKAAFSQDFLTVSFFSPLISTVKAENFRLRNAIGRRFCC